jgi:hypothetical protein
MISSPAGWRERGMIANAEFSSGKLNMKPDLSDIHCHWESI